MIAVIGDIHGCYNTLNDLVEKIISNYPAIKVYSVGDLVDRGNFSYEVFEFIKANDIEFTPGNHDYMFYHFIKQSQNRMARAWLQNGYEKTLASYNRNKGVISDHLDMIVNAPLFIDTGDCFISHAGISVEYRQLLTRHILCDGYALNAVVSRNLESSNSIIWARGELMNIGKLQVVGHTRRDEVEFNKASNVLYIDTSVYMMNKLSAVVIENNNVLDIFSVPTRIEDLA